MKQNDAKQSVFDKRQYLGNTCIKTYILCNIIDLCNQSCKYCYNKIPRTGVKLDLSKLSEFIVYLIQHENKKCIEVILLGGEPTLHEQLIDFCSQMENLDVRCTIISNFSNDINLYLTLLSLNNVFFDFSWHSSYNCSTSFVDKIQLLPFKYFEDNRIDITVMYEQEAHEDSLHIFNQLSQKYRKFMDLAFISPTQNKYTYTYTDKQLLEHYHATEARKTVRQEYDNISFQRNNVIVDIATNDVMHPTSMLSDFKKWFCNAGQDQFYVHYNGDIAACIDMYLQGKTIFGNIYALSKLKKLHCTLCQIDTCTCPFYAKKTKIF